MEEVRVLHNNAKRELIQGLAFGRVLDVGCGFGGDIHKYNMCSNVREVVMCDPDPFSVEEARNRYSAIKKRYKPFSFVVGDITTMTGLYDTIVYNFSLQYVFENNTIFEKFVENVSKKLKTDGVLIGCIPNSERILTATPYSDQYGNIIHRKVEETGNGEIGEYCYVKIGGPFYNDEVKKEPIAYKDVLVSELEAIGITLVQWYPLVYEPCPPISKFYSRFIFKKTC